MTMSIVLGQLRLGGDLQIASSPAPCLGRKKGLPAWLHRVPFPELPTKIDAEGCDDEETHDDGLAGVHDETCRPESRRVRGLFLSVGPSASLSTYLTGLVHFFASRSPRLVEVESVRSHVEIPQKVLDKPKAALHSW